MPDIATGQDKDLLAVPLSSLVQALCCAFRVPALVEHGIPFHAEPFRFSGEVRQAQTQLTMNLIFQVPAGMTGAITGVSLTEKYVGIMAGTKVSLLINGETTPWLPRVGANLGIGPGMPMEVFIPLKESDQVGLFLDCPWDPMTFTSAVEIEYGISFVLQGYYVDKEIYRKDMDNMEVGVIPASCATGDSGGCS